MGNLWVVPQPLWPHWIRKWHFATTCKANPTLQSISKECGFYWECFGEVDEKEEQYCVILNNSWSKSRLTFPSSCSNSSLAQIHLNHRSPNSLLASPSCCLQPFVYSRCALVPSLFRLSSPAFLCLSPSSVSKAFYPGTTHFRRKQGIAHPSKNIQAFCCILKDYNYSLSLTYYLEKCEQKWKLQKVTSIGVISSPISCNAW